VLNQVWQKSAVGNVERTSCSSSSPPLAKSGHDMTRTKRSRFRLSVFTRDGCSTKGITVHEPACIYALGGTSKTSTDITGQTLLRSPHIDPASILDLHLHPRLSCLNRLLSYPTFKTRPVIGRLMSCSKLRHAHMQRRNKAIAISTSHQLGPAIGNVLIRPSD
jgi:hypothetical protein